MRGAAATASLTHALVHHDHRTMVDSCYRGRMTGMRVTGVTVIQPSSTSFSDEKRLSFECEAGGYAPSCTFLAADAPLVASSRADISRHVMGKVFIGLSIAANEEVSAVAPLGCWIGRGSQHHLTPETRAYIALCRSATSAAGSLNYRRGGSCCRSRRRTRYLRSAPADVLYKH